MMIRFHRRAVPVALAAIDDQPGSATGTVRRREVRNRQSEDA